MDQPFNKTQPIYLQIIQHLCQQVALDLISKMGFSRDEAIEAFVGCLIKPGCIRQQKIGELGFWLYLKKNCASRELNLRPMEKLTVKN